VKRKKFGASRGKWLSKEKNTSIEQNMQGVRENAIAVYSV
jgi:hypothetical protein